MRKQKSQYYPWERTHGTASDYISGSILKAPRLSRSRIRSAEIYTPRPGISPLLPTFGGSSREGNDHGEEFRPDSWPRHTWWDFCGDSQLDSEFDLGAGPRFPEPRVRAGGR